MAKNPTTSKDAADKLVRNIRHKTRQTYSAEEKSRIVLDGNFGGNILHHPGFVRFWKRFPLSSKKKEPCGAVKLD